MAERPLIAITLGDPAGIGPEVAVKALGRAAPRREARLFLLGDLFMHTVRWNWGRPGNEISFF